MGISANHQEDFTQEDSFPDVETSHVNMLVEATSKDLFNIPLTELPVLLDLRSSIHYRTSHIVGALSVPIQEIISTTNDTSSSSRTIPTLQRCHSFLRDIMATALEDRGYDSYRKVVIYYDQDESENIISTSTSPSVEEMLIESITRYGLPIGPLIHDVYHPTSIIVMKRGYEQEFLRLFPFLAVEDSRSPFSSNTDEIFYPSLIDEKWGLFLGSFYHAKTELVLLNLHIDVILNMTVECANTFEDRSIRSNNGEDKLIEYHRFFVIDNPQQSMEEHWIQAAEILRTCKKNNKRVLVHCAKGASRSASTIVYYLMKYENFSMKQALKYLKSCRPIVEPNEGFIKQLLLVEAKINGRII